MRFPDSFLRQVRDRVSIADYAGKRLQWAKGKTRPAAGDYWAPCPFHTEKTASFHVRDREGVYKCFGCGAAGDVFKLCQQMEGVSFPEAVERLAGEAGLPMPQMSPAEQQSADRSQKWLALMAEADKRYRAALLSPLGEKARLYLEKRGLGEMEWARFGLGFAPDGWSWLADQMAKAGVAFTDLETVGLAKMGQRGPIDVFRNRILFPIADNQGRTIAFGGRAMDANDPAKYLNSPQTPLFDKGRTLYRLKEARAIAAKAKAGGLVLAEGYMDVIAFERAGIGAAAPLGTALTEDQLQLAWRAGGEPVLCFDGDAAGQRAAARALDLALPHVAPGRTVKVALLPQGEDPDDVFRSAGPDALHALLQRAVPAIEALFTREHAAKPLTTPESIADFKARLKKAAMTIREPETQKLYLRALNEKSWQALRPAERGKGARKIAPSAAASVELKAQAGRTRDAAMEDALRLAVDHPSLLERGGELLARLPIVDPDLSAVRNSILSLLALNLEVDRANLRHHLRELGEERAVARVGSWPPVKLAKGRPTDERAMGLEDDDSASHGVPREVDGASKNAAALAAVAAEWFGFMAFYVSQPTLAEDLNALQANGGVDDDAAFAQMQALLQAKRRAELDALARGRDQDWSALTPKRPNDHAA
jgi:DNA primase